jgi:hypothetical protein
MTSEQTLWSKHGSPMSPEEREYQDSFVWTPELFADYAERARELAERFGGGDPTAGLRRVGSGDCADCGEEVEQRYQLGQRRFCRRHVAERLRVRRQIAEAAA